MASSLNCASRRPQLASNLGGKVTRQQDDVIAALRSTGTSIGKTASRKNKSPRNSPPSTACFQVLIRRGNHAHIDSNRRASTDPIHDLLLDGAQQFSLYCKRQLTNSSRNTVPPEASSNFPCRRSFAPVKSATLVTEELILNQRFGNGRHN
jgi:hypothetical protein